jgi:hypothetical protein
MLLDNQFGVKNNSVLTLESNKKLIHLDKNFIDLLVGFTLFFWRNFFSLETEITKKKLAEGNFNISL